MPVLDAVDNTALPLVLDGVAPSVAKKKAVDWLEKLGLKERLHNRPDQLSGGQQQRVAIARALAIEPALILADEPTGNLDSKTGDEVIALIRKISTDWGRTVLMVTHDSRMAAYADRIVFLKDGSIVDETRLSGNERNGEEKSELIRERVDRI
ncbi:ABC transporter ATP-binding protein [Thermicanus aegyptius]|uniref:ABC transporter ATP-binding protein n=1 Tax=Thermicanus aegyptius TaxID=94009 RepID=UPI00316ACC49